MAQPPTIYKPGKLNHVVNYYSKTLNEFGTVMSPYVSKGLEPLPFKTGSIGPKVSFKKTSGSDPNTHKDIIIPGLLEITRGNGGGGIYNIATESQFNGNVSPENTTWNTQYLNAANTSWAPLWDIQSRTFDTWRNAIETPEGDNAPPLYVGMPTIMKYDDGDILKYYLIMFTEWGIGDTGNYGFAYDRWELPSQVFFEKPDYETSTVDKISDGVWLARNDNGPLYNAISETESYVGASPKNTRWNSQYTDSRAGYSGFDDLSNLESRVYTDFALALDYQIGNNVIGTDLIMHDLTTDLYYKFQFGSWTNNNNGGGFSYNRTVIPQSTPIKFADGTVMTTAATSSSSGPVVDSEGNVIVGDSSNNPVIVPNGATHFIPDFSGMLMVTDLFGGRVELWLAGSGDTVLVSYTQVSGGSPTNTLVMDGNGYLWTNNDNFGNDGDIGITFTVIKTRNGS